MQYNKFIKVVDFSNSSPLPHFFHTISIQFFHELFNLNRHHKSKFMKKKLGQKF